jgi:hypothetical protein
MINTSCDQINLWAIRDQSNWLEEIATYLNIGEFYRLRIYLRNLV